MKKITGFFTSNRIILLVSFICSVIIWLSVSVVYSPVTDVVISDVGITIPLSETERTANLKVYGGEDAKVKVMVSGKKYVIQQLNSSSITVTADLSDVTVSGEYVLKLSATKAQAGDYKINSVEPSSIRVTLDVEKTATFDVPIDCVGATVKNANKENESFILEPEFVNPEDKMLTVTGPEKEVAQIVGARAYTNVDKELTATTRYDANIMLFGENDTIIYDSGNQNEGTLKHVNLSYTTAPISAKVLLRKTLPLNYNKVNAPENVSNIGLYEVIENEAITDDKVTTIGVKGEPSVVEKLTEIMLNGTVDFSKIDLSNPSTAQFKLELPSIAGVTFEEYSSIENIYFTAVVDTSNLTSKSFNIPAENIKISNSPQGKTATIKTGIKMVTVIGTSYDLNRIDSSDIVVTVDCATATAATTLTPTFSISGGKSCFVSGKYDVTVDIS